MSRIGVARSLVALRFQQGFDTKRAVRVKRSDESDWSDSSDRSNSALPRMHSLVVGAADFSLGLHALAIGEVEVKE
jgi:hypothetical protein